MGFEPTTSSLRSQNGAFLTTCAARVKCILFRSLCTDSGLDAGLSSGVFPDWFWQESGKKTAGYRLDVMIFLADASEKTLAALKELGFVQTGESKAVKLSIGTLDVRKLEDLAKLGAVIRIKPVVEP